MSLQNMLRAFEERFYRWDLRDFQREIEQGFPFLRRVAYPTSMRVIAIMTSLPRERQLRLASTLVRANRVWIASHLPIDWTSEDEKIHAWYRERVSQPTPEELELNFREVMAGKRFDKQKLMRAVRHQLATVFPEGLQLATVFPEGPPEERDEDLHYCTNLHGFQVETVVLRGHTTWQISYYHRIRHDPIGFDVKDISLYSWLGLTNTTNWCYITDATIPKAAQTVRDLICHFLEAAKELLNAG